MRNLIWLVGTGTFAIALLAMAYVGYVGNGITDRVTVVTVLLCLAAVAALLRCFVQRNFDEHGNWTGRWY